MSYGTKPSMFGGAQTNTADEAHLRTKVVFGASSAIASQVGNFLKVTKTGTGAFKAQLTSSWGRLINLSHGWICASGAPLAFVVVDETHLVSSGYITFETRSSGTAADPTSGDTLMIDFVMTDSLVNAKRTT